MSSLQEKQCRPCAKGTRPLAKPEVAELLDQVQGWSVVDDHHLLKAFVFPDFVTALDFVNRVGEIAEVEAHHPELRLSWGRAEIEIFTHSVGGLSENDFILAAKIDGVF